MKLPQVVAKYFWGDNLEELSFQKYQDYIASNILEQGDEKAISWLFKQISPQKLRKKLTSLNLSPKSARFWQLILK